LLSHFSKRRTIFFCEPCANAGCLHCIECTAYYFVHNRARRPKHAIDNVHRARRNRGQETPGKLAKSTGRSRSFLAAEALDQYLDVNEWQVAGVKQAMTSLDRGEGVTHKDVKDWVKSWGGKRERPAPKRSAT